MVRNALVVTAAIALFACGGDATDSSGSAETEALTGVDGIDEAPAGMHGTLRAAGLKRPKGSGIYYHGGPIMLGTVRFYYIWYGDWTGNTATTILADFASNLGGSPYWNIQSTYYDGNDAHAANVAEYAGSTTDAYSRGPSLSDSDVLGVVADAIGGGALPADPSGVYFVLTSADVAETSGFCSRYCGWHTHATVAGNDIKYAFIGNPDRCPSSCAAQSTGPNGNAGADGMASIIAHEAEEAVTDPDLDAWYDRRGYENADKCAWTFGATYSVDGAQANVKLGARDYLIQQNWVNAGRGYCAMSY